MIDQKNLSRIMIRNGQPGHTTRTVQDLIWGTGPATVWYTSVNGESLQKTIVLQ